MLKLANATPVERPGVHHLDNDETLARMVLDRLDDPKVSER